MTLLCLSLLTSLAAPPAEAAALPLLHGGDAAPHTWLAALRGALWVCWHDASDRGAPDPTCWRRVELPSGVSDPAELRATILDPGSIALRGPDDAAFLLVRGDLAAQPIEPDALPADPQARLAALPCSPGGHVPEVIGGAWSWRAAACAEGQAICVAQSPLPRPRRPLGLGLRVGVELRAAERRSLAETARAVAGLQLLAVIAWSFDPARWFSHDRGREQVLAAGRARLRTLPPLRSRGALAARERAALSAALCRGGRT